MTETKRPNDEVAGSNEGEVTTLLGRGSEFSGRLSFDGAVRIDGRFSGEIHSEGLLVVGPQAEIEAEIEVGSLLVQGRVTGNLTATHSIELHAPSRVQGKLVCPELLVEKGVILNGSCEMTGGGPKAPSDPIPGKKEAS